ncbi:hypothetical protein WR25_03431 [Diploscapter pachys]|uniref:Major facilitator superfamily (MFS) profile domain-containing protein n=1 Tax=Diploscapter pachys TaxID=2018661 RepID=A0A2A2J729_9BILA|nr:hypothetical protein WR25_03431 [Diploscapter pachys]
MAPPIMKGMLMCFKRPQFLMQLFLFASILSTQLLFLLAICDIINDRGYNLQNYPSTVNTLFGCIFAIPIGAYVDRTKRFASMSNLLLALTAITVIALRIFLIMPYHSFWQIPVLFALCAILGVVSASPLAIFLEVGVETVFPVLEATSTGLSILVSQLCLFSEYEIIKQAQKTSWLYEPSKTPEVGNWQLTLDIWCLLIVLAAIIAVFWNRPKYFT